MKTENENQETTGTLEVDTPHDGVVKRFLREKETVKSLFREYLPPGVAALLDLDTLEFLKDDFVGKVLGQYSSDYLYKVKFKGHKEAFIFLLLEHKSWAYRLVAFQVLKYIVLIWDDYLADNKNAKYLPPVIPVVLYHGKGKWNLDKRFSILYNNPGLMKKFLPDFRYLLLDISHSPDEKIKGNPVLKILLMTLKYIFKPQLRNKLREIFRLFVGINDKESALDYLETLLVYLMSSAGKLEREDIKAPVSEVFKQGGELMATIAEKLKSEGINEGEIKGRNEAKWDVVKNSLREGLSIDIIERISGFTSAQINEFKEKMKGDFANAPA